MMPRRSVSSRRASKLVSLFTIPYLAGVLGPSGWVASLGLTGLYAMEILK